MADRPSVKVFCDITDSHKVIESVEASAADFGLAVALELELRNTLQMIKIASGPMVCIVPAGHQLARRPVVTPIDLKPFPLIALSGLTRLNPLVRYAYRAAGVSYIAAIEVRYSETACLLVGAGAGISVVDVFSAIAHAKQQNIVAVPFRPETVVDAWAIFKKERPLSRLAMALLDEAQHAALAFLAPRPALTSEQPRGSGPARRSTKVRQVRMDREN
jgi:DNA-binding transcriptional LysR family regulator